MLVLATKFVLICYSNNMKLKHNGKPTPALEHSQETTPPPTTARATEHVVEHVEPPATVL